mmetsp:Transcript_38402/g.63605  ORF Transcript_38402/g.63605 Transcript_38402/m.63605 type:complete len:100 (-) Transcript_38402:344-643(-)
MPATRTKCNRSVVRIVPFELRTRMNFEVLRRLIVLHALQKRLKVGVDTHEASAVSTVGVEDNEEEENNTAAERQNDEREKAHGADIAFALDAVGRRKLH